MDYKNFMRGRRIMSGHTNESLAEELGCSERTAMDMCTRLPAPVARWHKLADLLGLTDEERAALLGDADVQTIRSAAGRQPKGEDSNTAPIAAPPIRTEIT